MIVARTIRLSTAADGSTWRRKTRRWTSTRQRTLCGSWHVGRRCLWIRYYPCIGS